MALTDALLHTEPAPPGPDLPGQVAALQRKAERHKAAIARLEKTLAQTKTALSLAQDHRELLRLAAQEAVYLLSEARAEEAAFLLDEARLALLVGPRALRQRTLALVRKRDTTLLTLRAKVKELHGALKLADELLAAEGLAIDEIKDALGE